MWHPPPDLIALARRHSWLQEGARLRPGVAIKHRVLACARAERRLNQLLQSKVRDAVAALFDDRHHQLREIAVTRGLERDLIVTTGRKQHIIAERVGDRAARPPGPPGAL